MSKIHSAFYLRQSGRAVPWLIAGAGFVALVLSLLLFFFRAGEEVAVDPVAAPADQSQTVAPDPAPQTSPLPSFDVVRISREGTGVIAGRAMPGATVDILKDQVLLGQATADARGEWVFLLERPLAPGAAELQLRAMGDDGVALSSEGSVVISVPEQVPDGFVASDRDGVVAVLSYDDADQGSRVLQRPGAINSGAARLRIDTVDYGADLTPIFAGRAAPRSRVQIYVNNAFLDTVEADVEGNWRLASDQTLPAGDHVVRLDQVIGEGRVELRVEQPFATGEPLDTGLAERGVRVRQGNSLWEISRTLLGSGRRFTLIFQENSDRISDPELIYPNQVFRLPDQTDES